MTTPHTPGQRLIRWDQLEPLLASLSQIAVLGIKPESHAMQPAFYVPQALQRAGLRIIPVPVYYPAVTTILNEPVVRDLKQLPQALDLVNIFRRPDDLPPHLEDLIAIRPKAVWLQSGIEHEAFASALIDAGISVVQDRCLMVDYRRFKHG